VHASLYIPNYKCPGEDSLQNCLDIYIKGHTNYRKDFAYKNDLLFEFNAREIHYPVAFVHPIDVFDVQIAVNCGAKLNFTVIARSGGHSDESYSIGDKDCALIIDLRYMSKIMIDVTTQTAKIETGNTLNTLYYSLNEHVFAFPSGECPTIGVGGIILGGGVGTTMRKFGMSSDNILDAQIVLANGTIVNHAKKYSDLFWALRGAGNAGYGIVTALTLKIYPIQKIVTSMVFTYDFDQIQLVYSVMNKLGNNFHQNLSLEFKHVNDTHKIYGYYLGSLNEAKPHVQKFIELTKPKNVSYVEGDWYNRFFLTNLPDRVVTKSKSFYIDSPGLSYEGVEYVMKFMKNFKCSISMVTLLTGGGKENEIGRKETAFVHRDSMYWMIMEATLDKDNYEICLKDFKIFSRIFRKNYASFESYQTHIDRELDNWQCRYYAENFGKLVKMKQKYDPNNLFNLNQNIPTNTEISCQ
ncbi:3262_t:CDS:2, partial [Dentiscutata heterogama]